MVVEEEIEGVRCVWVGAGRCWVAHRLFSHLNYPDRLFNPFFVDIFNF